MCTFIKMHKNTQNPLRVLPDTPLTAHFYRLKRRFLTVFFIAKQVFFGRKKLFFCRFRIIFWVLLAEIFIFLPSLASFCSISHWRMQRWEMWCERRSCGKTRRWGRLQTLYRLRAWAEVHSKRPHGGLLSGFFPDLWILLGQCFRPKPFAVRRMHCFWRIRLLPHCTVWWGSARYAKEDARPSHAATSCNSLHVQKEWWSSRGPHLKG